MKKLFSFLPIGLIAILLSLSAVQAQAQPFPCYNTHLYV
jgi:hypothetical protein